MASSIRYLSGRDQFIGLGIAWPTDDPNWKLPLDPAQYPGAIAWAQDQLHYWSDGSQWIPLLNLPIDTPYIVPPSNEYEKRCITVTPFRSTLNIEHTGTVFQAYDTPLIEGVNPILEIRLTKDGSWLIDELNSRRYVLDENISGNSTISVELPNKTYGDIVYLRAQYIGEGANSRWSPLYGQTLPKRIAEPKLELPNLGTADQFLLNPIPSNVDSIIGYNDYWNFAGAVYEIYTDPGLTNLVESGQINPSNTVEFANLLAGEIAYNGSSLEDGTLYFYRVRYLANSSFYGSWEGDWSETRSFYPVANSIVLDIDTTLSVGTTFRLLLGSRDANISGSVNWGDGNITPFSGFNGDLEVSNTYASEGQYTVVIKLDLAALGMLSHIGGDSFSANSESSQAKITAVKALGEDMGLSSLNYAFRNCINLTSLPDVLPKYNGGANGITSLSSTFGGCISLGKPNIARWDVSTVNTFESCFNGCISFNADIGNWDMSSATNLRSMYLIEMLIVGDQELQAVKVMLVYLKTAKNLIDH